MLKKCCIIVDKSSYVKNDVEKWITCELKITFYSGAMFFGEYFIEFLFKFMVIFKSITLIPSHHIPSQNIPDHDRKQLHNLKPLHH